MSTEFAMSTASSTCLGIVLGLLLVTFDVKEEFLTSLTMGQFSLVLTEFGHLLEGI